MAQAKHRPFSFYVPEDDAQLMRFVKSQSNLSLSVRLLMKAFLSAYKDDLQDVAAADLSDLISGVCLENIQGMQAAKPAERQAPAPAMDAGTGRAEETAAQEGPAPSAGGTAPGTGAPAAPAPEPRQETPAQPAEHTQDHQEPAGEPDPVPEVEAEPERPVRLVGSERTAYNQSRLPEKKATEDDLMAMMGEL